MARPDTPSDSAPRAADGRIPGRRGRETRQRLLDRLAEMLQTRSYRELKVTDVSREAGTSPATFYQYFADIESAVLVLAEETAARGAELRHLIGDQPWQGRSGYDTARAIVDGLLEFWRTHQPVLRVVDLATEERDVRFHRLRVRMLNAVTTALADVVGEQQSAGAIPQDVQPMATAGALVSMLAHVAAHQDGMAAWGIDTHDLRQSMARLVFWGVTGQRPPMTEDVRASAG